jgi:membrane-associated phospholipid phosphatase
VQAMMPETNPPGPSGRVRPARRVAFGLTLTISMAIQPISVVAQVDASPPLDPSVIHWWHGAVLLGGLSALMILDHPARSYFQNNRSTDGDNLAGALRHFGQPEVYGTVTLGLLGAGLISGDHDLSRAGGRLAATLALAGAASTGFKWVAGRPRPNASLDADGYRPFSGQDAMPSGHTTVAFALATSLADDLHRPWATVGLYTIAAGVGWSRLNDNKHWLTDVGMGAVVGVMSAKLVNGRWRIFNLHPPRVLVGPQHIGLTWHLSF